MACVKERRERVIDRNAVCGLREAVCGKPSKRDLRRVALPLVVAAVWLATVLALPGRASAISRDFELSTASSLMLGSGAVLGGDYAVYAPGTVFPVELGALGSQGAFSMRVGSFFVPAIRLPLGGSVFAFEMLEGGAPTDSVTLTLDVGTGAVNPGLGDPRLRLRMSRIFEGQRVGVGEFEVSLTTGEAPIPECGNIPAGSLSGTPLAAQTGAVALVGGACVAGLAGIPSPMLFQIKLAGTLPCLSGDADRDGALDADDNCRDRSNPSQRDTNHDGFGNACDVDYTNDGVVDAADLFAFARAFGRRAGEPGFDPDLDTNGDGLIGSAEFMLLGKSFGRAPGPVGTCVQAAGGA